MLHPDELTFQVTHQASELLMKGAAWELDRARLHIHEGDLKNAARLLRRATKMLDYPLRMLSLLEGITPYEYHIIRAGLGHGSGLDSPGFLALLHISPRLADAFFEQLKSAGLTLGRALPSAHRILRTARPRRGVGRLRRAHATVSLCPSQARTANYWWGRSRNNGNTGRSIETTHGISVVPGALGCA